MNMHWGLLTLKPGASVFFKYLVVILTLFTISILVACNSNGKTELELNAEFLYKKNVRIFSYKSVDTRLSQYGFDRSFNDIEQIEKYDYTVILFDANKYNTFDTDFLNEIYDLLFSNKKIIIIFANSSDLTFLEDSKFSFSDDNYIRPNKLNGYYNFSPGGVAGFSTQIYTDSPEDLLSLSVISAIYTKVYNDVRVQ